jgi:hypothetical protein
VCLPGRRGHGPANDLGVGRPLPLFDDDNLPATVIPAVRANVVRLLGLPAIRARDQGGEGNVVMAAPVALMCPADALLR